MHLSAAESALGNVHPRKLLRSRYHSVCSPSEVSDCAGNIPILVRDYNNDRVDLKSAAIVNRHAIDMS